MSTEDRKQMGKLVSKVWSDDALKQRFLADPAGVMRENGIAVPAGTTIRVHEDTENVHNVVLPRRPGSLTEEQLDLVAGGGDPVALTITAVVPT